MADEFTVDELRDAKSATEEAISYAIHNFEFKFGVVVEAVDVHRQEVQVAGEGNNALLLNVKMRAHL